MLRGIHRHLTSTTDWCQGRGLPALKTKRTVPAQTLSRCFKDRHKPSRRRGGRRSIPGWMGGGSLTRRQEAATAVRGQETPRAVGTDRPGLYLEGAGSTEGCEAQEVPQPPLGAPGASCTHIIASNKGPEGGGGLCHSLKSPTNRYHQLRRDQGLVYIETCSADFS